MGSNIRSRMRKRTNGKRVAPSATWAALFDLNGVIANDEELHETAFKRVLREEGFDLSHRAYQRFFAGRTDRDGLEAYTDTVAQEQRLNLSKMLREKESIYSRLAHQGVKTYPGAVDLIKRLAADHIPLAIVTSALLSEAEAILETSGVKRFFQTIVDARSLRRGKPAPDGYRKAARRLHVTPRHCIVIEDTPSGIAAAHAAGMKCLAVANTHSHKSLRDADFVVNRLGSANLPTIRNILGPNEEKG